MENDLEITNHDFNNSNRNRESGHILIGETEDEYWL